MSEPDRDEEQEVREIANFLWESEGRPDGRDTAHWERALILRADRARNADEAYAKDEEAVIDGDPRADMPALSTKDVAGG